MDLHRADLPAQHLFTVHRQPCLPEFGPCVWPTDWEHYAGIDACELPENHPLRSLPRYWLGAVVLPSTVDEHGASTVRDRFTLEEAQTLTERLIASDEEAAEYMRDWEARNAS